MKLIYQITIRISLILSIALFIWAVIFYYNIIDEINDETEDVLEDYSELLIMRALSGEDMPMSFDGTNNSYYILPVSREYARENPDIRYSDEMVYISYKRETEPAKILKSIYKDYDDNYFELTVLIPTIEKDDLKETILYLIIFLYVVLLMIIIAINIWVLHRSFRPLYTLLNWLGNYNINQKNEPLKNDTPVTEFRKLNQAVQQSMERNEQMYEQQKLFIAHASHELQTPLAICRNRLEMLSEDSELNQRQLEELMKTQQTINNMIKLNKTLLLLSKIENGQFPDKQEIDINKLIEKLLSDFSEVFAHRHIETQLIEKENLKIMMNESLASILFSNLIKNAFIYNIDSGTIAIEIDKQNIAIGNDGAPTALDNRKIFERFYQGTKKEGAAGLGLALAESICKLYHLEIRYAFENGKHFFRISVK